MSLVEVRYKGFSDVREMSKKDLSDAGVQVDGLLRWERKNGWRVLVKDPSDRLLEILEQEGTFTVTEVTEDGREGQKFVTASKADDTGATVVDGTTGQVSTAGSASGTGSTGRGRSTGGGKTTVGGST